MLYTQLFDSEMTPTRRDRDVAEEILKLLVFSRSRPKISTTTVTDSRLFLNRAASDPHFIQLVRDGEILFPRWSNGMNPTEALIAQIEDPTVVFTDWPRNLNQVESLKNDAIRCIRTGKPTGDDELTETIENARRLYDAIECSPSSSISFELDRRPILCRKLRGTRAHFAERLSRGSKGLTPQQWSAMRVIVKHVPDSGRRSVLYDWNNETVAEELRPMIKNWIDMLWNECFPIALKGYTKFHGATIGDSPYLTQGTTASAPIKIVGDLAPSMFRRVEWQDLCELRADPDMRQELASRYAARCIGNSKLFVVAGVGSALGVAAFAGALQGWAVTVAALTAAGAAVEGIKIAEESIRKSTEARLGGFLKAVL